MELSEAIKKRRSIRRFDKEKNISDKKLKAIVEAGTWAPSDCNLQGWNFVVVKNDKIKQRMVNEAGSNARILKSPITMVVCYSNFDPIVGIQSVSAAVQNMLLKATSMGISSCWIASCGDRKKLKKILNIPDHNNISSLVVFGYPQYSVDNPPPRKPLDNVLHFDRYNPDFDFNYSYDPNKWTIEQIDTHQYYYCRKTAFGVKMELSNKWEFDLIKEKIPKTKNKTLDIMTYDGLYIEFLKDKQLISLDLNDQTKKYTEAAAKNTNKQIKQIVLKNKKIPLPDNSISVATCLFKIERLPNDFIPELFSEIRRVLKNNGKFLLIFRNNKSLYSVFHYLLKARFGDDVRKSAIYSYFGPYKPIGVSTVVRELKEAKFNITNKSKHFFIPPRISNVYQLYLQYKKSGGTTFLHRIHQKNKITKLIERILDKQGTSKTPFGSISVIEARCMK